MLNKYLTTLLGLALVGLILLVIDAQRPVEAASQGSSIGRIYIQGDGVACYALSNGTPLGCAQIAERGTPEVR